jgi:TrpR family transcriptional regulator, trp operon repressor
MKSKPVIETLFLPKSNETKGWNSFCKLCTTYQDPKDLSELFELMMTTEEKFALSMRYQLIKELLEGELSQRDIAKKLNVSISKITRGSNGLKTFSAEFKKDLLAKIKKL